MQLPTLETDRLILRPPSREDFDPFAAFMADERTARHVGGVVPRSTAWRQFAAVAGSWMLYGYSMFTVIEKSTGAWIGRTGPWMPDGWPGPEVGWAIASRAQRKGYATEAAGAALDWVFDVLAWPEVIHCIERANTASVATALKLGSTLLRTDVPAPAPHDHVRFDIYGQTRDQWRARRGESR